MLVLFSGRPLTLPWAFENVPAVIAAWFPGIQAGPALVRTLYGESNPSGRLVVSWPRSVGQEPLYYNALSTGRPFGVGEEQKYVSRYLDEQNTPQFPFGFGLSYTTFQYGSTEINSKSLKASQLSSALNKKVRHRPDRDRGCNQLRIDSPAKKSCSFTFVWKEPARRSPCVL